MSKLPRPERIDLEGPGCFPGSFLLVGKLEAFHEGLLLYSGGEAIWRTKSGCLSVNLS